ncbi:hypothetical protein M1M25_gp034 [Tenacibaculum phage Gundel_1]|uniref:Uncharacterized protein n=1 Tax=Tenacibaculum phage Gundel_1 TaxID=2745672 RepID=A0A8E5EBL0_9CAUD|nr:hypothetical protein M1M25_gp034 [Tenacibaculum phage Gundel_1]QQV91466.1 hypothetical protein Gundel1_34 [Tenacibaculum phage Gundel_1]
MTKTPEQFIKELFPDVPHKDRKIITNTILIASNRFNKPFDSLALEYKEKHDKEREEGLPIMLNHCLNTALLIESNHSLQGSYFSSYYNKISGNNGRAFMNAQNKLYLKEFNHLATEQSANINDLLKFKEIALEALSHSFDEDFEDLAEIIDVWSKNKGERKRILGIARKIKKDENS